MLGVTWRDFSHIFVGQDIGSTIISIKFQVKEFRDFRRTEFYCPKSRMTWGNKKDYDDADNTVAAADDYSV